jgi:hypothetical protein
MPPSRRRSRLGGPAAAEQRVVLVAAESSDGDLRAATGDEIDDADLSSNHLMSPPTVRYRLLSRDLISG